MKVWTVDAFANRPYTGNPAAVMIVDTFPPEQICQKIAAEINLSETVFVRPLINGTFHIRWFTPKVEVDLCGHGTLAATHILFQEGLAPHDTITFSSLSGTLTASREDAFLVLDFPLQKIGMPLSVDTLATILKMKFPIVAAVQVFDDIILELETAEAVRHLNLNPTDVLKLDCHGLIVTAKGSGPYDFVSRYFAPREGIDEDPVTGSAHCKLADYWHQKLGKDTFLAYQASERGGVLQVAIQGNRVLLKGHAVTIMAGNWLIGINS